MTGPRPGAPGRIRVGWLPYLNVLPLAPGLAQGAELAALAPPRRLGQLLAAGAIDAAPLASRDFLALGHRVRPLGPLGIACRGAVASVLLFSPRPARELGGARIALSAESRTSRALLRILLADALGVSGVEFVEEGEAAEALLAIGDRALELAGIPLPGLPHRLDLGALWTRHTGLPFVYARLAVRREVDPDEAEALLRAFDAALDKPLELAGAALPPGVTPGAARRYLRRFTYRLGPAEEAGLDRFRKELLRHDLLDRPRPSSRCHPGGPRPR